MGGWSQLRETRTIRAGQLPWVSWLVEGFDNSGLLYTIAVPSALAGRLRSPDGRAALHRFRRADDPLPHLVAEARKLL